MNRAAAGSNPQLAAQFMPAPTSVLTGTRPAAIAENPPSRPTACIFYFVLHLRSFHYSDRTKEKKVL